MIFIKDDDSREAVPTPELAAAIVMQNLNEIADRHGYDIRLSGGLDRPTDPERIGKNAWASSWHPFGMAWDYTLVYRPGTPKPTEGLYGIVAVELREAVGKLFDVVSRPHGTGSHIHVEMDVKGRLV